MYFVKYIIGIEDKAFGLFIIYPFRSRVNFSTYCYYNRIKLHYLLNRTLAYNYDLFDISFRFKNYDFSFVCYHLCITVFIRILKKY